MGAHGPICESLRKDAPAEDLKVPLLILDKFGNLSPTCANCPNKTQSFTYDVTPICDGSWNCVNHAWCWDKF